MTYQRPVYEQVEISHGGNTVTLRPTLRAAAILEQRYGLAALFNALESHNFTIISEIIRAVSSPAHDGAGFLRSEAAGSPLISFFNAVTEPLAALISMLTPAPVPSSATAKPQTGKGITWAEYYAELYEAATGWLGWTPEQAWNATPNEISRAYQSHINRLVKTGVLTLAKTAEKPHDIEQAKRNEAIGLDPEFDREALRALKMKIASAA